jgi:hypothetical protein
MKPHITPDTVILWEGECAYVARTGGCYEVRVFWGDLERPAGLTDCGARAESMCLRLNAYPHHTRSAFWPGREG